MAKMTDEEKIFWMYIYAKTIESEKLRNIARTAADEALRDFREVCEMHDKGIA